MALRAKLGYQCCLIWRWNSYCSIDSGESFTLSISNDFNPLSESLYYYCTAHSSMVNGFSAVVVPEPSTYALIFGLLALVAIIHRRK